MSSVSSTPSQNSYPTAATRTVVDISDIENPSDCELVSQPATPKGLLSTCFGTTSPSSSNLSTRRYQHLQGENLSAASAQYRPPLLGNNHNRVTREQLPTSRNPQDAAKMERRPLLDGGGGKEVETWIEILKSRPRCCAKDNLSDINKLPAEVLDKVFSEIIDHPHAVDRCMKNITLQNLLKIFNITNNQYQNYIESLITQLKGCKKNVNSALIERPPSQIPAKPGMIESLTTALEFSPQNPYLIGTSIQIFASILAFPFLASMTLPPLLEGYVNVDRASVFGGAVAVMLIALITLKVRRHYNPVSDHIRPLDNYRLLAERANPPPLTGRATQIKEVLDCLVSANEKTRIIPLLVGPAGSGKTEILKEIGRLINAGEVPEPLKNKKFFCGNAATLLGPAGIFGSNPLDDFLQRAEKVRNDAIIGLDEIHVFMSKKQGQHEGTRLKSMLDTTGFPFLIGATTDREYEEYIAKDGACDRRFKVIRVMPLTREESIRALRVSAESLYPKIDVPDGFIEEIYEQTEKYREQHPNFSVKQPEISQQILSKCIANAYPRKGIESYSEKLVSLRSEQQSLKSALLESLSDEKKTQAILGKMEENEKTTETEETRLRLEESVLAEIETISRDIIKNKNKLIDLSSEIKNLAQPNWTEEALIKTIIFTVKKTLPTLEKNRDQRRMVINRLSSELIKAQLNQYASSREPTEEKKD